MTTQTKIANVVYGGWRFFGCGVERMTIQDDPSTAVNDVVQRRNERGAQGGGAVNVTRHGNGSRDEARGNGVVEVA